MMEHSKEYVMKKWAENFHMKNKNEALNGKRGSFKQALKSML